MGLLTFATNVTLDGCVDHREGIADDETHDFFTRLMDESGAMLWGRVTYEMMESYWPAVARGAEEAPPAMREWAVKLEAKPKYVVSSTRKDFPWTNSHHIGGDLRAGVQRLKDATPKGVLLGSGKLATELDRLELIDDYKFLVHPRLAGHGPTLLPERSARDAAARAGLGEAAPQRRGGDALPPRPLIHRSPHGGQLAGERDAEDRGGDPQMLRNQGLELVAGTGTRRAAPAAPASVLRQMPETVRDTSQLESHPAENADLFTSAWITRHCATTGERRTVTRRFITTSGIRS